MRVIFVRALKYFQINMMQQRLHSTRFLETRLMLLYL